MDGKAASYLRLKTNLSLCVFPLCSTVVVPWFGGTSTGYWAALLTNCTEGLKHSNTEEMYHIVVVLCVCVF